MVCITKFLFCVFVMVLGVGSSYAQSINIDKIPTKDRHVILIEIAKNVAETLGPGYTSYFGKPVVSPPRKLCKDDYDDSAPEIRNVASFSEMLSMVKGLSSALI